MTIFRMRTAAALSGGAAALILVIGLPPQAAASAPRASAASSIATPAPPSPPGPGGALPVQPAGGGGCVIGLNCGCIRNITCPKTHPRPPGVVGGRQPAPVAPDPQTP